MSITKSILNAVFELCPSDRFDQQLGALRPNDRIRRTISHPRETLALLRRQFQEEDLIAAGVAKLDAFGELQMAPELCQAGGVVMTLRKSLAELPFDLVTARGSLAGGEHPVLSVLADGRRAARVGVTGMMLAAFRACDVAVLDLIGLPATHGFGLSRLDLNGCRELNVLYGEGLPGFETSCLAAEEQEAVDETDTEEDSSWEGLAPNESTALRPMLILIDQIDRRQEYEPSHWLQNTARRFVEVRRHTGLSFAGVWVWQPDDDFGERLKFAFRARDKEQIRQVVEQSLASLVDIESVVESVDGSRDEAPSYLTARSALIDQLTAGSIELSAQGNRLADLHDQYDSAVRRELADPLISWARQSGNPVIYDAGTQLADVMTLLHRTTPRLHALQVNRLAGYSGGGGALLESGLFDEYMRLLDRCPS